MNVSTIFYVVALSFLSLIHQFHYGPGFTFILSTTGDRDRSSTTSHRYQSRSPRQLRRQLGRHLGIPLSPSATRSIPRGRNPRFARTRQQSPTEHGARGHPATVARRLVARRRTSRRFPVERPGKRSCDVSLQKSDKHCCHRQHHGGSSLRTQRTRRHGTQNLHKSRSGTRS